MRNSVFFLWFGSCFRFISLHYIITEPRSERERNYHYSSRGFSFTTLRPGISLISPDDSNSETIDCTAVFWSPLGQLPFLILVPLQLTWEKAFRTAPLFLTPTLPLFLSSPYYPTLLSYFLGTFISPCTPSFHLYPGLSLWQWEKSHHIPLTLDKQSSFSKTKDEHN